MLKTDDIHSPKTGISVFWERADITGKSWTDMLRFSDESYWKSANLVFLCERQCSVFSSDFQRFRRYWTDMLRFFSRFQADFQLKSGWIEPRLVGGYAPFSPEWRVKEWCCKAFWHFKAQSYTQREPWNKSRIFPGLCIEDKWSSVLQVPFRQRSTDDRW